MKIMIFCFKVSLLAAASTIFFCAGWLPSVASASTIASNSGSYLGINSGYSYDLNALSLYRLQIAADLYPSISGNAGAIVLQGVSKVTGASGDATVSIYSSSGGRPGSLLAGPEVLDISTVYTDAGTGGEATASFCGSGVALDTGTEYWIVLSETDFSDVSMFFWNPVSGSGSSGTENNGTIGSPSWTGGSIGSFGYLLSDDSDCSGGGGGSTASLSTDDATSSLGQSEQNLYNGFVVFFFSFFGVVWLLTKKR